MSDSGYPESFVCKYCQYVLPSLNYNLRDHSCFASLDEENEELIYTSEKILYRAPKTMDKCVDEENETLEMTQDQISESDFISGNNNSTQSKAEPPRKNPYLQYMSKELAEMCDQYVDEENENPEIIEDQTSQMDYTPDNCNSTQTKTKTPKKNGVRITKWSSYEEELIEEVRKRDPLWNHQLPVQSRSPLIKKELWEEVTKQFNGIFSVLEVKKHWKYLYDNYRKERAKRNEYVPSGSAGKPKKSMSGYRFYDQMVFLDDTLEHRPTIGNVGPSTPDDLDASHQNDQRNQENAGSQEIFFHDDATRGIKRTPFRETNNFREPAKIRKAEALDINFKRELLKTIVDSNKEPDDVEGCLITVGHALRKMEYKNRREIEKQILDLVYDKEVELGLL